MKDNEHDYLKSPPERPEKKDTDQVSDDRSVTWTSDDGRVAWTSNGEVSLCSFTNHPDNFPDGVRAGVNNLDVSVKEKPVNKTGRRRRNP